MEILFGVAVNTNDNLVYTVLTAGKFGVYNHSNGVWMNLSGNDTGNWAGISTVLGVAVNTNDNLVYTALDSGKFGVYNHSNGAWMNYLEMIQEIAGISLFWVLQLIQMII